MNREILFKGKRIDNREWVEGNLFVIRNKTYIVIGVETTSLDSKNIDLYVGDWHEVDPDTICQYICTNNNGNRIWENDIVQGKCMEIMDIGNLLESFNII